MGFINNIIRANDARKSRLHDAKGHMVDFAGLTYIPKVILSGFLRKAFNVRPKQPWISYRAIKKIDQIMQPNWNVIEFGSGTSTAWIAKRCSSLYSIEDNEEWFHYVSNKLNETNININYELRTIDNYSDLSNVEDFSLDFALIDGVNRGDCMLEVINKIKKGGYIYLDNTDKHPNDPQGDLRVAENLLLDAVTNRNGTTQYFIDFAPSQFFVSEGL